MGMSVGISLLSCIRVEMYVMSYLLPVDGCHRRFTIYQDVDQYSHSTLPDPENMGLVVEKSFLSCMQAEMYVTSYIFPFYGCNI